jgi:WhiB family redox-sensing transcriptional regulator
MSVVGLVSSIAAQQVWMQDALCAQVDVGDIFYPETGGSTREAKAICAVCPVRAACLQYALDRNEQHGIFGGYSDRERRRMRKGKPAERLLCQRGHEYAKVGRRSDGSCVQCRRDAGRRYERSA